MLVRRALCATEQDVERTRDGCAEPTRCVALWYDQSHNPSDIYGKKSTGYVS